MPAAVWQTRRPPSPRACLIALACAGLVHPTLSAQPAAAQSSVGIYSDATGIGCSLTDLTPGPINAYVVVRPGQNGVAGVQFSAPRPSCFTATYIADANAPNTLVIGNSQTGVSVALLGCLAGPAHVLTIQYFGTGTTPTCCAYPVIADPLLTDVLVVDCAFSEEVATGVVSTINADASCVCAGNSAPGKPYGPDPVAGASGVSVFQTLSWFASDVDGNLAEFDVYLGTDPFPPLVASGIPQPSYTPAQMAPLATHYWRVVARDAGGLDTSGDVWSFTTRTTNSPPGAPHTPIPFHGAVALPTSIVLGWSGSDIDGDVLVYDVYFGTSSAPPLVASNVALPSYALPTLAFGTTFYWRIVARDPMGEQTTGPVWAFATRPVTYPPPAPSNPSPSDFATNVSINVTLSWQCSDPDNDPLVFDIYFGTSTTPPLLSAAVPAKSYALPELTAGTQYYWRIVARDSLTQTSGPVWRFRTGGNLPPAVPSFPVPAHNAVNASVVAPLQWFCSDPNGDPLRYDVYLGTASPPQLAATNIAVRFYNPAALAFLQQYYWRIVARDSYGAETSGPIWAFTTKSNSPPNPPSNPNPQNNGTGSTAPLLSWSATDPDGQPLTHDVYFGTTSTPPLAATALPSAAYQPGILQVSVTYYWRVVSSDGEFATSGPTWSFTAGIPGGVTQSSVEIYSDAAGNDCSLSDVSAGPVSAYVFVRPDAGGATGLQFAAPTPPCFTGVYIGENSAPETLVIGNTQAGISVALGGCFTSPRLVVTIHYFGYGTTPPCCEYPLLNDPAVSDILVVDCNFTEERSRGGSLTINEDGSCPCGTLTPVLISRFSASATGGGVEVRWELGGDESAERFTLLRREGFSAYPVIAGEGSLTGSTGSYVDTAVEPATTYHYELLVRTADGHEFRSPVATVTTDARALALGQNHPNPFNPTTVIPYTLPNGSAPVRVRLLILDVAGGVVRTLVDENQAGGPREAVWDGRDDRGGPVSSGVYFYVLDADGQRRTRKLVLLK